MIPVFSTADILQSEMTTPTVPSTEPPTYYPPIPRKQRTWPESDDDEGE